MRRISDWPILARLSAGFGVVCVLLAAVVAVGWVSLGSARDESKQLAAVSKPSDQFRAFQTQIGGMQTLETTVAAYAQTGDPLASGGGKAAHDSFVKQAAATGDRTIAAIHRQLTPAERRPFDAISK